MKINHIHINIKLIIILIISNLLVNTYAKNTQDTLVISNDDTFILAIHVLDTVPCKYAYYRGGVKGKLLKIKVDKVFKQMLTNVYNSTEEVLAVEYLLVPYDLSSSLDKGIIITREQDSKEYFIFSRQFFPQSFNSFVIKEDLMDGWGYGVGLGKRYKTFFFEPWLFKLKLTDKPCGLAWKLKIEAKDPILKCIKKYERRNKRKERRKRCCF